MVTITGQLAAIDLVGPKGYIHGWIFVGIPGPGQEVYHPQHGRGTVAGSGGGRVQVDFAAGHSKSFPVRAHQGPGHFEEMTDDELAAEYNRSEGSRTDAIVSELDRRDQRDADAAAQAKAERVSALYAERPKTEADQNRVYQSLVNEGENPEDAWAHAHGTNPEAMQKQSVIQDLRAQGHKGSGFDALTAAAHKDDIRRRTVMAENATNGYMLSPAGKKAGVDPYSLFTGPESRARKYASPELKEWFDQNGRPTVADLRASMMGQKAGMKPADFYASVTRDDPDAGVELSTISGQALDLAADVTVAPEAMKPPGLPVPDDPAAISMFTAHRVNSILHQVAHATERMQAAHAASGDLRAYHVTHIAEHLQRALDSAREMTANLREHYPPEAAELEQVKELIGLAKAVTPTTKAATTAHLTETTLHELTHAALHAQAMGKDDPGGDEWAFDADHCQSHLAGSVEHAGKLWEHYVDNYPQEGRWLKGIAVITHPLEAAQQHAGTISGQLDLSAASEKRGLRGRWTSGEPAYHGTSAELKPGDLIEPGHEANFDVTAPGHVYFTDEAHYGAAVNHAKRAARTKGGHPHVYRVEPTGEAEHDPDYAVSGGSFRTKQPLRVVGEDDLWQTDPRFAK
jgi:hypothetical protein